MVGDGLVDIQAGKAAGCRTVLVAKLKISQVEQFFDIEGVEPDAVASHLKEAGDVILKGVKPGRRRE